MGEDHSGWHIPVPSPSRWHAPAPMVQRMLFGLAGLMVAVALIAWLAAPWIEAGGRWFVTNFGLGGVFVAVVFTDTFFLANEPILGLAYAGGMRFWPVAGVACVASVFAGMVGWLFGRQLGASPWVRRVIQRQEVNALLHRWGLWAVAIAAISPIPYGAATWAAGAAEVPLRTVLLGSLFRIPRVLVYFWLVVTVWDGVAA